MDLYSSTDVTYFIEQGKYFEWSTIVYIYTASNPDQELALRGYVLGIDCVDDLFYMQGFSRGDKNGNWVADYSFNTEYSSTDTYGYETKGFETYFKMHFIPTSDVVLTPYGTSANDMNLDVTYICDGSVSDAYGCSLLPEYRDYKKGEVYNVNIDLVYVNVNGSGQYPVGSGIANYAPAGFYSDYFTMKGDEYFEGTLLDPLQVSEIHFKWAHRSHDNYTETKNYVSSNYYDEVTKCKYCNYEYWRYIRPAPPPTEECDHNWKYTYNETSHWQYCTKCGDTTKKAAHEDFTCTPLPKKTEDTCCIESCVCGFSRNCTCFYCDCGTTHAHNYTNWKDNGDGTHTGTCKCGHTIKEAHSQSGTKAKAFNEGEGVKTHVYYCSKCTYLFTDKPEPCRDTTTTTLYYDCATVTLARCTICNNDVSVQIQPYELKLHKLSCTYVDDTYHTYSKCIVCGYDFGGQKFEHVIKSYNSEWIKKPTCTAGGTFKWICDECNHTCGNVVDTNPTTHTFDHEGSKYDEWDLITYYGTTELSGNAICFGTGKARRYKCVNCNAYENYTFADPYVAHSPLYKELIPGKSYELVGYTTWSLFTGTTSYGICGVCGKNIMTNFYWNSQAPNSPWHSY